VVIFVCNERLQKTRYDCVNLEPYFESQLRPFVALPTPEKSCQVAAYMQLIQEFVSSILSPLSGWVWYLYFSFIKWFSCTLRLCRFSVAFYKVLRSRSMLNILYTQPWNFLARIWEYFPRFLNTESRWNVSTIFTWKCKGIIPYNWNICYILASCCINL
jgi:hypothetical protein